MEGVVPEPTGTGRWRLIAERCTECDAPTGRAGRDEDSIYVCYPDDEIGPLCDTCRDNHWVCGECGECGEGVRSHDVTYERLHDGCGGICE